MNERIKELAEQSLPNVKFWNEEITKGNTPPNSRAITLNELEKFAELIVRECAKIGDRHGGIKVRSAITKHFGVEE